MGGSLQIVIFLDIVIFLPDIVELCVNYTIFI